MDGSTHPLLQEERFRSLAAFAWLQLTGPERRALGILADTALTATALVRSISAEEDCSLTAAWNGLRRLRAAGFIARRGGMLRLTPAGLLLGGG